MFANQFRKLSPELRNKQLRNRRVPAVSGGAHRCAAGVHRAAPRPVAEDRRGAVAVAAGAGRFRRTICRCRAAGILLPQPGVAAVGVARRRGVGADRRVVGDHVVDGRWGFATSGGVPGWYIPAP